MTSVERWVYIRTELAKGRTFVDLSIELGIDHTRVVQISQQEHPPSRDTTPIRLELDKEYGGVTFLGDAPAPPDKKGRHGRFRCRCGTECVLPVAAVVRGNNTSCGCQANWESCRDRTYDRVCVVCHKAFQGGPNARTCGTDCQRLRRMEREAEQRPKRAAARKASRAKARAEAARKTANG